VIFYDEFEHRLNLRSPKFQVDYGPNDYKSLPVETKFSGYRGTARAYSDVVLSP
jgi:hypothetical protein